MAGKLDSCNMAATPIEETPTPRGLTDKERKYDRQLRLWAASGQAALESTKVLLVNSAAGTVGIETLKNLVLPGIGKFIIFDEAVVDEVDLGVNFFLNQSCLGQSRAKCCTELLLELNPEVTGDWYPKPEGLMKLHRLLEEQGDLSMIIYTLPLHSDQIQAIKEYGRRHQTPLVTVHCVGFYSYFRILLPGTYPVVDAHPEDAATTDLRLLAPWPELTSFASSLTEDINNLNDHDHGHLPMVAILLHYLDIWKMEHDGSYPISYIDKIAFRTKVSNAMRRDNPEGGEENFEEAIAAVMKHVTVSSIPSSLKEVFDYQLGDTTDGTSKFWAISQAVKQFHLEHHQLPVPGGLPDMKAQSNIYIQLQSIYKQKARQDAHEILNIARNMVGGDHIDLAEVELFCTNARFIKLLHNSQNPPHSIQQIVDQELHKNDIAIGAGLETPISLVPIYLALLAVSHTSAMSPEDIITAVCQMAPAMSGNQQMVQVAQEISRATGGELHNISAVTGGMAAQEVIKIITQQYVPLDNTCIFDGIGSRCQVIQV